jgi:putative SbcD/Mre11-related phosphoesterase
MNWLEHVKLLDYGAFIKQEGVLVIADLHLGYEEYLLKKGVTIPRNQFPKIIERINQMIEKTHPQTIVFAGDVQHDFAKLSFRTRTSVEKIINSFAGKKLVFLKGNHDTFLAGFLKNRGQDLREHFETKEFLVIHGHKAVNTGKTIIMAHEHPAIMLTDELGASRKYKCHLIGEKLLVIPAVSPLATGIVVNAEDEALSPLIVELGELKPFVQGLEFPRIKHLKKVVQ